MASIFGHGIVAYTITKVATKKSLKLLLVIALLSSMLPDIDVLAFHLGIPYEHPFGHRGFTHSLVFAIGWATLLAFSFGKSNKRLWFAIIFLSTTLHGVIDAMTNGGRGVGFLIPFNNERFFFPWRKIVVSPIHVEDFFSDWGLAVILSEIRYIVIPCLVIFVIDFVLKQGRNRN